MLVRCIQLPILVIDYIAISNAGADTAFSSRKLGVLAYAFSMLTHLSACFFSAIADDEMFLSGSSHR